MPSVATTELSSNGQVAIPEEIRGRLGPREGTQFVVVGEGDVVIFRSIAPPFTKEFDSLVRRARGATRQAGLKRANVQRAIKRSRTER